MTGMLVLLLIMLRTTGLTASCTCSSRCHCQNMGLSSVPRDLPTYITHLHLENNFITTLSPSDFSRYSILYYLFLTSNQISVINSRAFYNLNRLKWLKIDYNQLTSLREDMFVGLVNLERLWLANNNIHSIEAGAFNATPQLRKLTLPYNSISSIAAGAFVNLSRLELLVLYFNQITSLRVGMFAGLYNLPSLSLQYNNINSIDAGTFNTLQLRNLSILYLSNNNIGTFAEGAFVNLPHLNTLHLQYNSMETLPAIAYDILANISTVDITNNPWQCDCRMLPFKLRMTGSYSFESQITCAGPSHLQGKNILWDINPDDLICEETTTGIYSTPSTSSPVDHKNFFMLKLLLIHDVMLGNKSSVKSTLCAQRRVRTKIHAE
uniref:LRRCT domain-containing protein n=1 Tax=Branchiostoma floridae TaxID=7739 RepID=C3ZQ58_BRAFL|eukprot:XP_002589426.1 hypothetical protein BRAFLDRAFT_77871 [Branchiostoma floridae]